MTEFVIHALRVGGGTLALAPLPGRGGDYAADLEHLREWQPALLISLTTLGEMAENGAARLGQDMQDRGARWIHLPIPDFGTPGPDVNAKWPELSRFALQALHGGGRVLVHCMAGCGRSGMAALRLMIEAGEPPDAALTHLRRIRPCAVETEAQLRWAITPIPSG
ncbi:protein-tyrosine phosphatase family protein [Thalassovita sp.]|uniref:phosphatase domain-containing putative toxin n=1 Tax=Thalassovita sp. TaxID=1979401 RepID=UPI0029DE8824|nr:protein-tyrosine phosphatase family protein [Thalassovita sp.]